MRKDKGCIQINVTFKNKHIIFNSICDIAFKSLDIIIHSRVTMYRHTYYYDGTVICNCNLKVVECKHSAH